MKTNAFTQARLKRGWTLTRAANHMANVSEQQLRNVEGIGATRETNPAHIRIATALEIVRVYWPDLDLAHFLDTDLAVKPASPAAHRRLKGYAG